MKFDKIPEENFKELFLGDFSVDKREAALVDALQTYYTNTPDSMSNSDAAVHWSRFKEWAKLRGYTQEEINRAKQTRNYKL